jgi:ABC-2 type transport system ATP-binding protein
MITNRSSAISTHGLSKRYRGGKQQFALKNLNLEVRMGEIFGYLGPNGAGKTTTIKLLLDLIRPESGGAAIFGLDVHSHSVAIRRRIGYLPGDLSLWPGQMGRQVIDLFLAIRGHRDRRFADELCERLTFDPSKKVRAYSTGNRRKLGLVLALMHQPELLILDEPTNGLDPLLQQTFIELMREARASGQTVFLSSHVLSEVQAICDRVGILRDGQLLATDVVAEMGATGFRHVTLMLREPPPPAFLSGTQGISDVSVESTSVSLRLEGDFDPLLRSLNGVYVQSVQVHEPSLEDVFLAYYGDRTAANGGAQ